MLCLKNIVMCPDEGTAGVKGFLSVLFFFLLSNVIGTVLSDLKYQQYWDYDTLVWWKLRRELLNVKDSFPSWIFSIMYTKKETLMSYPCDRWVHAALRNNFGILVREFFGKIKNEPRHVKKDTNDIFSEQRFWCQLTGIMKNTQWKFYMRLYLSTTGCIFLFAKNNLICHFLWQTIHTLHIQMHPSLWPLSPHKTMRMSLL